MKAACKNVACAHYYKLSSGEHCQGEEQCEGYTSNKRKAAKKILRCKECSYCKAIYTDGGSRYHWECTANDRRKTILLIEERICDYRR